jgi:hypothetical protein
MAALASDLLVPARQLTCSRPRGRARGSCGVPALVVAQRRNCIQQLPSGPKTRRQSAFRSSAVNPRQDRHVYVILTECGLILSEALASLKACHRTRRPRKRPPPPELAQTAGRAQPSARNASSDLGASGAEVHPGAAKPGHLLGPNETGRRRLIVEDLTEPGLGSVNLPCRLLAPVL